MQRTCGNGCNTYMPHGMSVLPEASCRSQDKECLSVFLLQRKKTCFLLNGQKDDRQFYALVHLLNTVFPDGRLPEHGDSVRQNCSRPAAA